VKTIRRLQIGEAELFKHIRLESLRDAPYAFSSTYDSALHRSEESWREQADSTAQGSDRATFIAFSNADPIGIAALYRLEDQNHIGKLLQVWVAPEYRGKGIAENLMDATFEWASENNFRTILCRVRTGNTRAQSFYTRYGFSNSNEFSSSDFDGVCLVKDVL
jgi:ribosomal protein S18 acetylase RimI-like enzyme